MSAPFLPGLHIDHGTGPVGRAGPRRRGPSEGRAHARFSYPQLEPPGPAAPPPPATAATAPPPPPPPTFSATELASAVATAWQAGFTEAEATLLAASDASLEHRQAAALAAIAERLTASQAALDQILAGRTGATRELALALARALVREALARQPLADIEAMLRAIVVRLEGLPWLELRLPPSLLPAGEAALRRIAAEADFQGEIRVLPDAKLGPGDVRLRWQDGAAERDLARLDAEIAALVEAWLPAAQAPPAAVEPASRSADPADPRTRGSA